MINACFQSIWTLKKSLLINQHDTLVQVDPLLTLIFKGASPTLSLLYKLLSELLQTCFTRATQTQAYVDQLRLTQWSLLSCWWYECHGFVTFVLGPRFRFVSLKRGSELCSHSWCLIALDVALKHALGSGCSLKVVSCNGIFLETHLFFFFFLFSFSFFKSCVFCVCLLTYSCTHSQPGKTWYKITLLSLTEVSFLSPQYKSWGAKVETPAQTDRSPQCQTSDRRQPCKQTLWSEWWMFDPPSAGGGRGVTVDATAVSICAVSGCTSHLQIHIRLWASLSTHILTCVY